MLLWIGFVGQVEAGIQRVPSDSVIWPLPDWEEPGMSAALQDKVRDIRYAALQRLMHRPTKNTELIQLTGGFMDDLESA